MNCNYKGLSIFALTLLVSACSDMQAGLINVTKVKQETTINCHTGDTFVLQRGEGHVGQAIRGDCVFIAGRTGDMHSFDLSTAIDLGRITDLMGKIYTFSGKEMVFRIVPSQGPLEGKEIFVGLTNQPIDEVGSEIKDRYQKDDIEAAFQLWRYVNYSNNQQLNEKVEKNFDWMLALPADASAQAQFYLAVQPNGNISIQNVENGQVDNRMSVEAKTGNPVMF
ncbi:MAG: hypothetical protein WD055_00385 [Candidatus Dependentiae bacterium]